MTFIEIYKQRGFKAAIDKLIFGRLLNLHWRIIQPILLKPSIYHFFKKYKWLEAEHQIGRLMNMDKIFKDISENNLDGDIIEFGSYQGFSLKWLVYFRKKYNLLEKRIIAIDAFEGLPHSSSHWRKGQFSDTSEGLLLKNLEKYANIKDLEQENIYIVCGYFNTESVNKRLIELTNKIVFAHIDCDLGSSCDEAFESLSLVLNNENFYLLFDDWGCGINEIPKSFNAYSNKYTGLEFNINSNTNLTRYFRVSNK